MRSNPARKKQCGGHAYTDSCTHAGANTSTIVAGTGSCSGAPAAQRRSGRYEHDNSDACGQDTDNDNPRLSHPMQHLGADIVDDDTAGRPKLIALRSDGTIAGWMGTATV